MWKANRFKRDARSAAWSLAVTGWVVASLLAAAPAPALADVVAGQEAFDKGDYQRAIIEWQAAADKGDAEAEFKLGSLYENGAGNLKQDYKQADLWYRKAADQGNTQAEYRLAFIWVSGGDDFPADYIEAYKWASLAGDSKGFWSTIAADLKRQMDKVMQRDEREAGTKRAAEWKDARDGKKAEPEPQVAVVTPPPQQQPPAPGGKPNNSGCPGWPFPTLPCTEQFPALGGAPRPAGNPAPSGGNPPPRTGNKAALDGLNEELAKIRCATASGQDTGQGSTAIGGTVPNNEEKAKVVQLVGRFFPDSRPAIHLEIVPPPLCQTLVELSGLRRAGLVKQEGLDLRLTNGTTQLHDGEVIELAVHAPGYPVVLRIDYFTVDGHVLHLAPKAQLPAPKLAAGATETFANSGDNLEWRISAPFGTELITALATPAAINLAARPVEEKAEDYLRDLKGALGKINAGAATPNALATLLLHTGGR